MTCTFANVIALPFTARSVPGSELMALFHSILTVTLKGGTKRGREGGRKEGLPPFYR